MTSKLRSWVPRDWTLPTLILVYWVARYWHSPAFGLYADDLTVVPRAIDMSAAEMAAYIATFIVHLYDDGRPLFNSLNYLLSSLGWQMAGLFGAYLVGFALQALNLALFYRLVERPYGPWVARWAGLGYLLFAADTTQVWLHRSLGADPSLTLLFLALQAYLDRRLLVAYPLAAVILLSYESPYPVFLAAPLLTPGPSAQKRREWARHAALGLVILAGGYLIRQAIGTERVTAQPPVEMIELSLLHMLQGPVVSLGTYLYRPIQVLVSRNVEALAMAAVSLPVFVWLTADRRGRTLPSREGTDPAGSVGPLRCFSRPLLVGLAMLALGYMLTFTVRAYAISGRDTRVHFAATPGAALVFAGVAGIAQAALRPASAPWLGRSIVALEASLLMGFGFVLQRDYVDAWRLQRELWSALLPQIQDAGEGTVILVDPIGLEDTRQIDATTWNLPRVLSGLYRMPAEWSPPPRVYRGLLDWREFLILPDGSLRINADTTISPPGEHTTTDWEHLIVIHTGTGVVRRRDPLVIDEIAYPLRPPGEPVLDQLERRPLYDLLILPDPSVGSP